ncbi:hypothetical protein OHA77_41215 [Streptosporangium sp. NBC_01639]|uniref:hypothetical protein n=1 Tax=Streptosporangium sp. NBC_01639 TaxID=2975948 RepID=UPI00386F847F|nr:hypothetical protein OHA77_41215 [Streptosporangium sp. NBC_01639]
MTRRWIAATTDVFLLAGDLLSLTSHAPSRGLAGDLSLQRAAGSRPAVAAVLLDFFTIMLDALIVNVALPSIGRGFGGGMTGPRSGWFLSTGRADGGGCLGDPASTFHAKYVKYY